MRRPGGKRPFCQRADGASGGPGHSNAPLSRNTEVIHKLRFGRGNGWNGWMDTDEQAVFCITDQGLGS